MDVTHDAYELADEVASRFAVSRAAVRVVFAPYRICPLGAHVDHQWGRVTAMALDRGVLFAYAPSEGPIARVVSKQYTGDVVVSVDRPPVGRQGDWGDYFRGAVFALRRKYSLKCGLMGIIHGSAVEGGLSSSAAVGVAYLLALEDVHALSVSVEDNIRLDQLIENEYLGLQNGVLDQSAILFARRGCLTRIDCAKLDVEQVEFPRDLPLPNILVVSSGVRRSLVTTDYNRRVAECAEAARILLAAAGKDTVDPRLGRVGRSEYELYRDHLSGALARRAAHFFGECRRVEQGVEAWHGGDLVEFGRLMTESGESSICLYECGSPPLIDLFEILARTPGVFGARFSGAGFRGCCVALVPCDGAAQIAERALAEYRRKHPELADGADAFVCDTGDGARWVEVATR